jgi:nucleotide-binding universal stress UspA family protein
MNKGPIIVGVDASAEAATAAQFGARLAAAAGVPCQLVHAVRDVWFSASIPAELAEQATNFDRAIRSDARFHVSQALKGKVPDALIDALELDSGSPADVLGRIAHRVWPSLIVLGGKHHSILGRWLSGSTSLNVARTATTPVLVTAGMPGEIRHVLVAVDASAAAGPTVALAREYAQLFNAELRVLSVLEPLPEMDEYAPPMDATRYYELCREMLQKDLVPQLPESHRTLLVRHGTPVDTILREATLWPADLLVVGSRGKNWAQRLLLGSVTEKLLNYLPTSVLVAPAPVKETVPQPALALEAIG